MRVAINAYQTQRHQENSQLGLQFESLEASSKFAEVIMPFNPIGAVYSSPIPKAAIGAERRYGT